MKKSNYIYLKLVNEINIIAIFEKETWKNIHVQRPTMITVQRDPKTGIYFQLIPYSIYSDGGEINKSLIVYKTRTCIADELVKFYKHYLTNKKTPMQVPQKEPEEDEKKEEDVEIQKELTPEIVEFYRNLEAKDVQ